MKFGQEELLRLLWGIPVLLGLGIWFVQRHERRAARFAAASLWGELAPFRSPGRRRTRFLLRMAAVTFVLLALAEPQWGARIESVRRSGVDVLILLDTSLSMEAQDLAPNRLERAKREIQAFLETLRGDRVALMPFAGTAYLACPLTLDYGAARMLLEATGPGSVPRPGTAIAEAIQRGLRVFEKGERKHKVMILITDGEDHEGKTREAAKAAADEGVVIHAVGMATTSGELIPLADRSGTFKKDRSGELVMSRLNESLLREVAEMTGGTYRRARPSGGELEAIAELVAGMEKKEFEGRDFVRYEARFQYALLAAVLLLLVEFAFPERRREPVPRPLEPIR